MKKLTYILLIIAIILSVSNFTLAEEGILASVNSEEYILSNINLLISRIMPKTTIGVFKTKFNIDAKNVHIYDEQGIKEITQGYIGTGMKIRFDNHQNTYTASVIGDLTGDGEIKQIEVSKAIKHVVGLKDEQLTGVNEISIDVSGDGVVTQKDVSILIKYVVFGQLEINELQKPTKPIVELISGTKGENDWYISDVSLRIRMPEESVVPISKMSCKITGTINKEETVINDGDIITIEEDGIYQIDCYTICANGLKSLATTTKIKIDKTQPISANLIATFIDENGEIYNFGEISYQNVYIKASDGQDDISKIGEITLEASGATEMPKGSKFPILLENNGTTDIVVTTKNNAGLITTKSFTVIIDKIIKNPGTVITKLNDENGIDYERNTWTNQDIYIAVQNGGEKITTTYMVDGANNVLETSEPTVISEEGISTITIINKDNYGNESRNQIEVKIDKTPSTVNDITLDVTGNKIIEDGQWYTSDVNVKISAQENNEGAKIKNIEYILKNVKTNGTSTDIIENGETVTLVSEGIFEISASVIDEAGNKSEAKTVEIKIDKSAPIAGTMSLYINEKDGQIYINDTWTNQNVYAEVVSGDDSISGHSSSVYKIENVTEHMAEPTTISKEGQYEITLTTTDIAGWTSERKYNVKIERQKPEPPTLEIISGEKSHITNEWYKGDITIRSVQGTKDNGGSGISYTTYAVSGPVVVEEQKIDEVTDLVVAADGIHTITVYNYDVAGNKSEGTSLTVKLDKTAPQNGQITVSELSGTSFHLKTTITENMSGVILYKYYIDDKLYKEIETNETTNEIDVTGLSSAIHNVKVIVKDLAGNETTITKSVTMGRLVADDIDYIEFIVNNFTQTKNNSTVTTGADFIVSDTSTSQDTKYIQVQTSDNGVTGKLSGIIKLKRKDGEIVQDFAYFPQDLLLEIGHYSDGSGSTWSHNAEANVLNTVLNNSSTEDGIQNNANVNVTQKQNSDNVFYIQDNKTTGTKTFSRLIIRQVTVNGEKLSFKITSNIGL